MAKNIATTTPERCICGRIPVYAKGKGTGYVVCCAGGKTCQHQPTSGTWSTLNQAVEAWNVAIRSLQAKEANK